jgi:CRISPR-associated protein Cmr6
MIPELEVLTPKRVGTDFSNAAPGHRFQIYLNYWEAGKFSSYKDARLPDIRHLAKGERDQIRAEFERRKHRAIGDSCPLPASSVDQIKALRARQKTQIAHHGAHGYSLSAVSVAPFATGLGNEHPIENGFAFLTPYGLPYLAGSGVKGIVRRAMQELRDDGVSGFTDEAIDALFGPEEVRQPEDARRGALDFWDVFPNPAGGKLCVEIMTPHFGEYYRGNQAPHDSGQPVPVSFLAVPPQSDFDFHVVCHTQRLPESLQTRWRELLGAALQYACEWVGFGAKTSVGYGALKPRAARPSATTSAAHSTRGGEAGASTSPVISWASATLTLNVGTGEVKASFNGQTAAGLKGAEADALRTALGAELAEKFKKKRELKGVAVEVEAVGNGWKLLRLASQSSTAP